MMKLTISIILAYVLSGVSQVMKDIGGRSLERPLWTTKPTFGKAILVATTWFTLPFIENVHPHGQVARGIAFGSLGVVVQMCFLTGFIWCCITISMYLFGSPVLQVISSAILIIIGALIVIPLLSLLMVPVIAVVALPLDLFFPIKREKSDYQEIKWCKSCKHHRKSKEYEHIMRGLWRSTAFPRSDKLPCSITLETSGVWKSYFDSEPKSRSLFPKECPFFERRA
jgi:hypothetical protein